MSARQATRTSLEAVAAHVLARRRHAVTGKFGLRATPGGFGTPALGPPDALEVVRVAGSKLVHEVGGDTTQHVPLHGVTIAELAALVGVDLDPSFSVGHDTPPLDSGAALDVDGDEAVAPLCAWFDLGWRILDGACCDATAPSVVQLWPEHFDAGCSVAVGADRCNLGASPGDGFSDEPYLYVGPWTDARPGDPSYWNAPFGAVLRRSETTDVAAGIAFLRRGLDLLTASTRPS